MFGRVREAFFCQYKKIIIFAGFFAFSLICSYFVYFLMGSSRTSLAIENQTASSIKEEIHSLLDQNENFLKYLSKQITPSVLQNDLNHVAKILIPASSLNFKSLTSSYVSFADANGVIQVNGKSGVQVHENKNIMERDYFHSAKTEPESIKLSKITKSLFSSKLVFPTAMGIQDGDKFLGYLILGINLDQLTRSLNKTCMPNIKFIINFKKYSGFVSYKDHDVFQIKNEDVSNDIFYDNKVFRKAESDKKYDFDVYVSSDTRIAYLSDLDVFLIPFVFFVVLSTFYAVYILVKKRFIIPMDCFSKTIQQSLHKKQTVDVDNCFRNSDNSRLFESISNIIKKCWENDSKFKGLEKLLLCSEMSNIENKKYYVSLIKKTKKDMIKILNQFNTSFSEDELEKFYKTTPESFASIENFISNEVRDDTNKSFDMNSLLEECVCFYSKELLDSKIILKKRYSKKIPLYTGNFLGIKHAILSCLNYAIGNIFSNGLINIVSTISEENNKKFIKIIVSYDGNMPSGDKKSKSNEIDSPIDNYYADYKNILKKINEIGVFITHGKSTITKNGFEFTLTLSTEHSKTLDNDLNKNNKKQKVIYFNDYQ